MLQWEEGEIGLSKEDQWRQEGRTDFWQEESRVHLTASVLKFKACSETHHTICPVTGWGGGSVGKRTWLNC